MLPKQEAQREPAPSAANPGGATPPPGQIDADSAGSGRNTPTLDLNRSPSWKIRLHDVDR